LGEDEFVEKFINYVKGYEEIKEIPKSQRYIGRPGLSELFKVARGRRQTTKKAREAVERYGYSRKDVSDYLGMHYSTVSRMVNKGI
ncbi:MAG: addiction module toxin RelE, partial [Nitrospirota bacterium]